MEEKIRMRVAPQLRKMKLWTADFLADCEGRYLWATRTQRRRYGLDSFAIFLAVGITEWEGLRKKSETIAGLRSQALVAERIPPAPSLV